MSQQASSAEIVLVFNGIQDLVYLFTCLSCELELYSYLKYFSYKLLILIVAKKYYIH